MADGGRRMVMRHASYAAVSGQPRMADSKRKQAAAPNEHSSVCHHPPSAVRAVTNPSESEILIVVAEIGLWIHFRHRELDRRILRRLLKVQPCFDGRTLVIPIGEQPFANLHHVAF